MTSTPAQRFANAATMLAALGGSLAILGGGFFRYMDPVGSIALAFAIGLSVAAALTAALEGWTAARSTLFLIAVVAVASFGLYVMIEAATAATANDKRCLAIQRDMLSAAPRRQDGPDLFQALGCRPQGEGSVYATSAKDRRFTLKEAKGR